MFTTLHHNHRSALLLLLHHHELILPLPRHLHRPGQSGRRPGVRTVGDEEDRADLPDHENTEDIQTGPAHHGAPDPRDDTQEQVREKPSVFLAN